MGNKKNIKKIIKKTVLKKSTNIDSKKLDTPKKILQTLALRGGKMLVSDLEEHLPYAVQKQFLKNGKFERRVFNQMLKRLAAQKFLKIIELKSGKKIEITKLGKQKALAHKLDEIKIKHPRFWDGKWRIISFEIPKEKQASKNYLIKKLADLDFSGIHKNVYLYPHACYEELEIITHHHGLSKHVRIFTAEYFDGDEKYRLYYNV